jgi:ComEC/Rec2-related protein
VSFFRPITILKIIFIAASAFIASRPQPQAAPPAGWVNPDGPPDYRNRLRAELKIERQINPGSYLVRVNVRAQETRWRRAWYPVSAPGTNIAQGGSMFPADFPVYLTLRGPVLHDGCTVHARITGRAVPRALSGGFGEYVRRQGATSTLWLSPKYHVESIQCTDPSARDAIRLWIEETIERRITNKTASAAAAGFVLGSAGYMDRTFKRRAAELGILHVFAASGMHLAILYGLLFLPAAWLWGRRHPVAVSIPLPVCAFYVWLLGFPVSLSRALVFVCFAAASCLFHRRLTASSLLLNSALVLAVWMPQEFVTLSSALSFGAVAGILLCAPVLFRLYSVQNKAVRFLWSQVLVTVSASIFTIPLLASVFGGHAYMSVIVNLLAIPLSDLVLPILFGALALEALVPALTGSLWLVCEKVMVLFCDATVAASRFSAYVEVPLVSLPVVSSGVLAILILYCAWCSARSALLCGPVLQGIRRAILVLVCLIGPLGALVSQTAASFPVAPPVSTFAGRPDSRFAGQPSASSVPTGRSVGNADEIQDRTDTRLDGRSSTAQPGAELSD